MSTGITLLILQHLHGHPITGYENPQNEYRYSSNYSSTFTWSPYKGYENAQNENRYSCTHSSTLTWSPYNRL